MGVEIGPVASGPGPRRQRLSLLWGDAGARHRIPDAGRDAVGEAHSVAAVVKEVAATDVLKVGRLGIPEVHRVVRPFLEDETEEERRHGQVDDLMRDSEALGL